MSPSDRVAQVYPQAPGSLFVAFYDPRGYSGGILTCLHTGIIRYYCGKIREDEISRTYSMYGA
jgi:hypothetical protein